jgi:hypothetical protein
MIAPAEVAVLSAISLLLTWTAFTGLSLFIFAHKTFFITTDEDENNPLHSEFTSI